MATVEATRPKKPNPPEPTAPAPAKPRRRRFRRWIILALFGVTLYFAPAIVGGTPLGQWILSSALHLNGTITLGSASLGWFSPVVVENLEIVDRAGAPLLQVDSLRSDKPLIAMLLDLSDLGRLHVEHPTLNVLAREKDSNLEEVFAELLTRQGGARVSAELEVAAGTITVDDAAAGRQFRIEDLALECTLAGPRQGIALAARGVLTDARQPGSFKIDVHTQGSAADPAAALASGKVDCQSTAIPLELFEPLLRRRIDRARLSGRLSTRLGGAWGEMAEGGETSLRGEALATGLVFTAQALGNDRIQLERIEMPCHIVQNGELVQVEQLGIQCELGHITLSGSAKLSDFSAADSLATLVRENYQLKGEADLARLAAMLPATLRIRQGTEITSGQAALNISSQPQPSGTTWTGHIDANHLAAHADGRALTWENPLAIQFTMHQTPGGLVVDRAQCTSSFLQIDAAGSLDDLTASAQFDLAKLISELRQFSDLDNLELTGSGQAQLVWKRVADDQFTALADFQARNFQLATAQGRTWKEDNLVARLELAGQLVGNSLKRVERAQLTVEMGGERLQAKLAEAIADPANAVWPLECSWRGPLANWPPRLEACTTLTGWELSGAGSAQATLNYSSKGLEIEHAQADFKPFQMWGNDWFVNEPELSATLEGHCDFAKSRLDVTQGKISAGSTLAIVNRAALQNSPAGWVLDGGSAEIEAELDRLFRWRHDPRTPAAWQVSGKLKGQAELKHENGITAGILDGTIDQFQVVDLARQAASNTSVSAWQEPHLVLAAHGNYQHASGQVQIDNVQLASAALRCDLNGTLPTSVRGGDVDLKGTVQYDWEQLAPLWRPYVGEGVWVAGQQTRAFAVHGRLSGDPTLGESWRQVSGEAALGWSGMNVHGLAVSRGDLAAQLADGQMRTQEIDVQVSEGRLTVAPLLRLHPAPAELLFGRGPVLTDVHLSPELCARGLKFVAPILAESTVPEGSFSIVLDGGRLPVSDLGGGDIAGKMAIRGQARPGPVAQEFLILINELTTILKRGVLANLNDQSGALLAIDDSNIEFRMVNRRVYHRGLQFTVGAVPITTHGSVGLDESLAIVAEIPLQATLLGIDLSLGTLEGQILQIPLEGTLSRPKLDRRALQQLTGQMLQNTAREVLIDGVGKQLERLFPVQP